MVNHFQCALQCRAKEMETPARTCGETNLSCNAFLMSGESCHLGIYNNFDGNDNGSGNISIWMKETNQDKNKGNKSTFILSL